MKTRLGFVSNSSSSSFVCQVCGRTESGWDAFPNDLGFVQCENGHLFCDNEVLDYEEDESHCQCGGECCNNCSNEDEDEEVENYLPECACPICQFQLSSKKDISTYLLKKYQIPRDEVFAKVKEKNKRRRKLYDVEYVNYVYEKFGLQENTVLSELKNEFKSYAEFLKSL
jgi:hypothetical protein